MRDRGVTEVLRVENEDDATRRTRLANERTYLAWWRSGLTALAVGLGAGKLVPELTGAQEWPYAVIGAAYLLLGIVFIAYGFRRRTAVERAVERCGYARPDERFLFALTALGVLVAVASAVVVVAPD